MRIMDLNVSHGSHYISTSNFPDYEKNIQLSILNLIEKLNIKKKMLFFMEGLKEGQVHFIMEQHSI